MDKCHIERQLPGIEEARYVREKDRGVITQPFLDDIAHVFCDEEAVHPEVACHFPVSVGRVSESQ